MANTQVPTIDPRRHGQYSLRLGRGFDAESKHSGYSTVRYNHKPSSSQSHRTSEISRYGKDGARLTIRDKEDGATSSYAYSGTRDASQGRYVLIFDQEAQTCTLEPVEASYSFNLTSTPWEQSQEKLAKDYEQLRPDTEGDEKFDEDPDGDPEEGNPYDFRHHLNINSRPSPSPSPASRPTTTNVTSIREKGIGATKPKPKPTPASKTSELAKRSAKQEKAEPPRAAAKKEKAIAGGKANARPTPTVRLERKASTRPNELPEKKLSKPSKRKEAKGSAKSEYYVHSSDDEDAEGEKDSDVAESGGLEIDWGNEAPKKARSRALELPGSVHSGPISLHSAANSPMGRLGRPSPQQKRAPENDRDVIDFGKSEAEQEDEDEDEQVTGMVSKEQDGDVVMQDEAESDDADVDVEPMPLGSPAYIKPPEQSPAAAVASADEDADFDDDFEAQMMEAMASADDDEEQRAGDESEESEAE